jgi:hypothetical protein
MGEPTANPRVPRSVVEGVIRDQDARLMAKVNTIAERNAVAEAKQKRITDRITSITHAAFDFAVMFGLAMACLEIWNAVVG